MEWTLFIVSVPCASPGHPSRERNFNSRWSYMISLCNHGGWSLWQLKSLRFWLELPEFYASFVLFYFLNDCPQRGADCITNADGTSLQSRHEFSVSKHCVQKIQVNNREQRAELDPDVHIYQPCTCFSMGAAVEFCKHRPRKLLCFREWIYFLIRHFLEL